MGESQHMINRRTVAKGIAWSVPAVAVASAAPAFASSYTLNITKGPACKLPGSSCESTNGTVKGYGINLSICHNSTEAVTFDITGAQVATAKNSTPEDAATGWSAYSAWDTYPTGVVNLPATGNKCTTVLVSVDKQGNSGNIAIKGTLSYTSTDADGHTSNGTITFYAATTPTCDGCEAPAPGTTVAVARAAAETTAVEEQTTEQQPAEDSSPEAVTQEPAEDITVESPKVEETPVAEAPDAEATGVESTE